MSRDARLELLGLVHLLRDAGLMVTTAQVIAFTEAAAELSPVDVVDLYWAGRATLVSHPGDLEVYDAVFRGFFLGGGVEAAEEVPAVEEVPVMTGSASPEAPVADEASSAVEAVGGAASDVEVLRHRRFDRATDDELRAMQSLMARIPVSVPRRMTRRTEPARRGRTPDLRRTLKGAMHTDGEVVHRAWRRRRRRARPLILILDVSGSMARTSQALLQFAFAMRRKLAQVEVFCFGTRLTRVTDELSDRNLDRALSAAAEQVVDWEGGTQIGASLESLNRTHGRRGLLRGAVVIICSDGLERGDPDRLRDEMARLHRFAHRVIWVNPLAGDVRYEPVQRGMRAALPHIDRLVSGHDLASLEELADLLDRI